MNILQLTESAERARKENLRMDIMTAMDQEQTHDAEHLARAAHAVLCAYARHEGQDPDIECSLVAPGQSFGDGAGQRWMACWEAGPYQWASSLSMAASVQFGLVETHWGFDLCFYPHEDYR